MGSSGSPLRRDPFAGFRHSDVRIPTHQWTTVVSGPSDVHSAEDPSWSGYHYLMSTFHSRTPSPSLYQPTTFLGPSRGSPSDSDPSRDPSGVSSGVSPLTDFRSRPVPPDQGLEKFGRWEGAVTEDLDGTGPGRSYPNNLPRPRSPPYLCPRSRPPTPEVIT